jgi:hypothetical protein
LETTDEQTGARCTRYEQETGDAQIFYYSSPGLSDDGRYLPCWSSAAGGWQIHVVDREENVSIQLTEGETTFDPDGPAFDTKRNRIYYRNGQFIRFVDINTLEDDWLFEIPKGFQGLHLSSNNEYLVFSFYETFPVGRTRDGSAIRSAAVLHYRPRSIIVAIDLNDGSAEHVWGDTNFLTHCIIASWDSTLVLFADQSWLNRQQEIFVVNREFTEAKKPTQLFTGYGLNYVGHSWMTSDGFIAAQYAEYLNVDRRNRFTDEVHYNAIIKEDGTGLRRARFPGGKKPTHCHAQRSGGLWVGDGWIKPDGAHDNGWLSIMRNRWQTQEMDIFPLFQTRHIWRRPFHPHPWISADEKEVVFASNFGEEHNHVAVVAIPQYLQTQSNSA